MTNPDVERVAKGLTKAQREVILALARDTRAPRRAISFSGETAAALRLPNTKRPALTDRNVTRNHGRKTAWYFLTDAGILVKDHLQQQGDDA